MRCCEGKRRQCFGEHTIVHVIEEPMEDFEYKNG